jgi:Sigma-70 region 2
MQAMNGQVELGETLSVCPLEEGGQEMSEISPSLYRAAFRRLGNPADAEDAGQDALLSAYKHLDQFKGHAPFMCLCPNPMERTTMFWWRIVSLTPR